MEIRKPERRQTVEEAPAATFDVGFPLDGPAGMESLLEQEQGGEFLPSQVFRGEELNTIPLNHKAATFEKFIQSRLGIDIEMPMELLVDGLQVTRADEGPVEVLAGAQREFVR